MSGNTSYADTKGRTAWLEERRKYQAMAHSDILKNTAGLLEKIAEDFPQSGEVSKAYYERLNSLAGEIRALQDLWTAYVDIFSDNVMGTIQKYRHEEENSAAFFTALRKCMKEINALKNEGMDLFDEFTEASAEMFNIEGHYDEMSNGSLSVPENAENHLYAANNDPLLDGIMQGMFEGGDFINHKRGYVSMKDVPLFSHDPSPDDIIQGPFGDCYFVSALSSICMNNPQAIRDMMKDNGDGTVTVRFFGEGKDSNVPYYVTVSKSVPRISAYDTVTRKDFDITLASKGAMWVQILEKAYASSGLHNGKFNKENKPMKLRSIHSGDSSRAIDAFFGGKNVVHEDLSTMFDNDDEFFQKLTDAIDDGKLVHAATISASRTDRILERYRADFKQSVQYSYSIPDKKPDLQKLRDAAWHNASYGLAMANPHKDERVRLADHAYSVVRTLEHNGNKYVVVRNPHGNQSFNAYGKSGSDEVGGYSTIPLKEFREIFRRTSVSVPITAAGYKNPADEVLNLNRSLMGALNRSRSVASYFTFRNSMSKDFRDVYDAMNTVEKLSKKKAPSRSAMLRAYADIRTKATRYLSTREDSAEINDDRNLRVSAAKAAVALADAFTNLKGAALSEKVREIEETALKERSVYALKKMNPKADPETVLNKAEYLDAIRNMSEDELLSQAFRQTSSKSEVKPQVQETRNKNEHAAQSEQNMFLK